jgi:hypothetical protein
VVAPIAALYGCASVFIQISSSMGVARIDPSGQSLSTILYAAADLPLVNIQANGGVPDNRFCSILSRETNGVGWGGVNDSGIIGSRA